MRKSKIFELIEGLSKKDLIQFGEFIQASICNKSKYIILLYKYFEENNWLILNENINKVEVYKFIYGEEKFNNTKLKLLFSDFIKLIKKFLVFNELENDELLQKRLLLKQLRLRNISKNYEYEYNNIQEERKKAFNHLDNFYEHIYFIERENYHYIRSKEGFENLPKLLNDISFDLDSFFCLHKANLFILNDSLKYVIDKNVVYNDYILPYSIIFRFFEKNKNKLLENAPLVYMRYLEHLVREDFQNDERYYALIEFYDANKEKFNDIIHSVIGNTLIEIITKRIVLAKIDKESISKNKKYLFDIISTLDDKNIRYIYTLHHLHLLNDLMFILDQKKYDYAIQYLNKYITKIHSDIRKDIHNLLKSIISFECKNYSEALSNLSKVRFVDYHCYFITKMMTIKIYYEQKQFELVINTIDAIKHSIKREKNKKIPEYLKKAFFSFTNYINKLTKYKLDNVNNLDIEKEKLKSEIINSKEIISDSPWLLAKIDEL